VTLKIEHGVLADGGDSLSNALVKGNNLSLFSVAPFAFKGQKVPIICNLAGLQDSVRVPQWVDNMHLEKGDPRGKMIDGGNDVPDWIDFNVAYVEKISAGEVKVSIGKISKYRVGQSSNDSLHSIMSIA